MIKERKGSEYFAKCGTRFVMTDEVGGTGWWMQVTCFDCMELMGVPAVLPDSEIEW